MKKNIKYLAIIFVFICIIATGCSCSKDEPNQNVNALMFYVPKDYTIRSDLRGAFYTDDTRKVFAKGDQSDYSSFEYIDVIRQINGKDLKEYVDEINTNNLNENDVKYSKKDNTEIEIYAREGYQTEQGDIKIINYAYLIRINNDNYIVTLSGPLNKKDDIETLSNKLVKSFRK